MPRPLVFHTMPTRIRNNSYTSEYATTPFLIVTELSEKELGGHWRGRSDWGSLIQRRGERSSKELSNRMSQVR